MRAVGRWLVDWRNGATLIGTVVVILLAFIVVDGSRARDKSVEAARQAVDTAREATANQSRSGQSATRRIDLLTTDLADLRAELDAVLAATTDAQRRTVVIEANQRRGTTTTTGQKATTSTTRPAVPPSPTTTTTAAPSPTTSTTACLVTVKGRCVP